MKPPVPVSGRPVLIIDDQPDPEPREAAARALTGWGYPVLVACEAMAAITLCEEVRPCLIVLGDMCETHMDTSTLLHELADILYEEPPPVAIIMRGLARPPHPPRLQLSPLLVLEDLLDGADERCAA